jgi:hypothetical protein
MQAQSDIVPIFATGVSETGGKFTASVVETGGNLPVFADERKRGDE